MKKKFLTISVALCIGVGMSAHAVIVAPNTVARSGVHSYPASGSQSVFTMDGSGLSEVLTDENLATVTHANGFDGAILYLSQGAPTNEVLDVELEYKWTIPLTNKLDTIVLWNYSQPDQLRSADSVIISIDTGSGYTTVTNLVMTQNDGYSPVTSDLLDLSALNLTDVAGVKVKLVQTKEDSFGYFTTGLSEIAFQFGGAYEPPPPPPDGLIVYFNADELSSPLVDQVDGITAEEVGTGHLYQQPSFPGFVYSVGLTSNAVWQLDVSESTALNELVNNYSIAAWVYVDSALEASKTGINANVHRIIGDDVAWDGDAWALGLNSTGDIIFTKNGVIDIPQPASVVRDEWHHIAVTVDSTVGVSFYVDGSLVVTDPNTANTIPGDDVFGIGRSNGDGEEQWFPGFLDEIHVFSGVLTEAQIDALMTPIPTESVTVSISGPVSGGTEMVLSWSNQVGRTYGVLTNNNLIVADWQFYTTGVSGVEAMIDVNVPIDDEQVFYLILSE